MTQVILASFVPSPLLQLTKTDDELISLTPVGSEAGASSLTPPPHSTTLVPKHPHQGPLCMLGDTTMTCRPIGLIVTLAFGILLVPLSFAAQQPGKVGLLPPVCEILLHAASGPPNGFGEKSTFLALTVCITWSI
jgi:hypothetical protein